MSQQCGKNAPLEETIRPVEVSRNNRSTGLITSRMFFWMVLIRMRLLKRLAVKLPTLGALLTRMIRVLSRLISRVRNMRLVVRRRAMFFARLRLRMIRLLIVILLNVNIVLDWIRLFMGPLLDRRMRVRILRMWFRGNRLRKLVRRWIAILRVPILQATLICLKVRLMNRFILRRRTRVCLGGSSVTLTWMSTRNLCGPCGVIPLLCVLFYLT